MAIICDWGITNLERHLADEIVYVVHYTISANDGVYSSSAYGSLELEPPEEDKVIPYSQLTSEIVIGWVKDKFGAEKVAEVEESLAQQIEQQRAPKTGTGLPWS